VTDANVLVGRLPEDVPLSGDLRLDVDAAWRSIDGLAHELALPPRRLALGILKLATLSMAAAVRRQTLERGRDPREFWLIASGGAGPMHACDVAAEVGIPRVAIPVHPGHYSAVGMLGANPRFERTRQLTRPLRDVTASVLGAVLQSLREEIAPLLPVRATGEQAGFRFRLALRYEGQEHTVSVANARHGLEVTDAFTVEFTIAFTEEYLRRYGHVDPTSRLELVEVEVIGEIELEQPSVSRSAPEREPVERRVEAWFGLDDAPVETRLLERGDLAAGVTIDGPCIITEDGATTVVPPTAVATVLEDLTILIDLDVLSS
jgi:N-methylhydantoinase A